MERPARRRERPGQGADAWRSRRGAAAARARADGGDAVGRPTWSLRTGTWGPARAAGNWTHASRLEWTHCVWSGTLPGPVIERAARRARRARGIDAPVRYDLTGVRWKCCSRGPWRVALNVEGNIRRKPDQCRRATEVSRSESGGCTHVDGAGGGYRSS